MPLSRALLFLVYKRDHIAGLAIECLTQLFQRDEVDPECLTFFQAPQRRMTDTRLLRQPIKRSSVRLK